MIIVIRRGYVVEVSNDGNPDTYQVVDLDLFDKQAIIDQAQTEIKIKSDSLETILANFKIYE